MVDIQFPIERPWDEAHIPAQWREARSMSDTGKRYLAAAIACGVVGMLVGYFAGSTSAGASGYIDFSYWAVRPLQFGGLWWLVGGAAMGTGLVYAFNKR
jgi:hypothetical protein